MERRNFVKATGVTLLGGAASTRTTLTTKQGTENGSEVTASQSRDHKHYVNVTRW